MTTLVWIGISAGGTFIGLIIGLVIGALFSRAQMSDLIYENQTLRQTLDDHQPRVGE